MVDKVYILINVEIHPTRTVMTDDGPEIIPARLYFEYLTELFENGILLATLPHHRGSAEFADNDAIVVISTDMTTRTVAEIKAAAGL